MRQHITFSKLMFDAGIFCDLGRCCDHGAARGDFGSIRLLRHLQQVKTDH